MSQSIPDKEQERSGFTAKRHSGMGIASFNISFAVELNALLIIFIVGVVKETYPENLQDD